jgi:hypothetical protein
MTEGVHDSRGAGRCVKFRKLGLFWSSCNTESSTPLAQLKINVLFFFVTLRSVNALSLFLLYVFLLSPIDKAQPCPRCSCTDLSCPPIESTLSD